eukprot:Sdes_comp17550_c0_seq1m6795
MDTFVKIVDVEEAGWDTKEEFSASGPVLFKNLLKHWDFSFWTPQALSKRFERAKVKVRFHRKDGPAEKIVWENKCIHRTMTLTEYFGWAQKSSSTQPDCASNL